MVKNKTPFPKEGDFVIGRVSDVQSQYIYVELMDYEGFNSEETARGMIHISEVSSRWVKNIRSVVRINQKLVLRVIKVVPDKGQVDLSLRRVNSAQRDKVLKENKYANKFENLLQFLTEAEGINMTLDQAYEMLGWPIKDQYNDYQDAVEALKEDGRTILDELDGIPENIKEIFLKIVDENVEISTVSIIGKLKLINTSGDGIDKIKDSLNEALKVIKAPKLTRMLSFSYLGAPFYRIEVISKDYIDAESILSETLSVLESKTKQYEGIMEFIRD
ncbi:MAG: S1 RNA-binding domain-containing protein [Candidatus Thorarchaeota archaeon]